MKSGSLIILLAILLSGCNSTPEVANPMARFESPEVHNEAFNFKVAIGSEKTNDINIDNSKKNSKTKATRLSAAMSLSHGFEINTVYDFDRNKVSLKYQWLGASLEQSNAKNYSLATSVGRWTFNDSGYSDNTKYRSWDLYQEVIDLAIIGGYRIDDKTLLYSSLFYQTGDIEGTITSSNTPFTDDGYGIGLSLAVEYQLFTWLAITGELVHHKNEWFNKNNSETGINANVEFRF